MDSITLKNFRCFREEQTVRLAPLTLLVGENSTGKTSFMAMIRALWDAVRNQRAPDFKEEPYDLGSFDEIAHYRGGRGGRATTFVAAFTESNGSTSFPGRRRNRGNEIRQPFEHHRFEVEFEESDTAPSIGRYCFYGSDSLSTWDHWIETDFRKNPGYLLTFGSPNGSWGATARPDHGDLVGKNPRLMPTVVFQLLASRYFELVPLKGPAKPPEEDWGRVFQLANDVEFIPVPYRPYAGAPVRSKPRRTYDPTRATPDPEGDYIPMFLANAHFRDQERWQGLKEALEKFGREAGLFDELSIRRLGKNISDPFQLQVRKYARKRKGPLRNLIDVGYGVSQVLPVVTELLRSGGPELFLLQQPEVHLHPSAQAALGSLFCQLAGTDRQLIVETHSDHLLDRIRMDIRDKKTSLKPADVSLLYFERGDLDVRIHEISFDEHGNVRNAPSTYRRFFAEETRRALRL